MKNGAKFQNTNVAVKSLKIFMVVERNCAMKLWVDDIRPPPEDYDFLAKTYEEAVLLLQTGIITYISLDHDLGTEKTGYDIAKFIEENAINGRLPKMKCKVHSMNPIGVLNIKLALRKAYKAWNKYNETSET
jgi:hypothetical protein